MALGREADRASALSRPAMMVLYADSGARDGVVPTAGTRDQIS